MKFLCQRYVCFCMLISVCRSGRDDPFYTDMIHTTGLMVTVVFHQLVNHMLFKKYFPVFWNNLVINKQVLNKHLNFICKNQDFTYQCNPWLIPGWEEEADFICIRKKFGARSVYKGLFLWRCKNSVGFHSKSFCFVFSICRVQIVQLSNEIWICFYLWVDSVSGTEYL